MPKKTKPAPETVSVPKAALHGVMFGFIEYADKVAFYKSIQTKKKYHLDRALFSGYPDDFDAVHRAMLAHERAKRGKR